MTRGLLAVAVAVPGSARAERIDANADAGGPIAMLWSIEVAEQHCASGKTAWRIEAYGRGGRVPVVLIDAGCRGVGRG